MYVSEPLTPVRALMHDHVFNAGPELAIDQDVEGDIKETCTNGMSSARVTEPWIAVDLGMLPHQKFGGMPVSITIRMGLSKILLMLLSSIGYYKNK